MYTTGPKIKWFRRELPRKSGPVPPHRPGYGPSPVKILRDGQLFYVGIEYVLANGASTPYKRLSKNFETLGGAKKYFQRITGKNHPNELREIFRNRCRNLHESSTIEREIVVFDLRDICVNFLEEKGYFLRGRVPISMIIKIENFVSDLLHQAVRRSLDIEMKGELGFGEP